MTLGDWLRIAQSFALLPLDTMINRVPSKCFHIEVVAKALRGFPHFVSVAGEPRFPITPPLQKVVIGYLVLSNYVITSRSRFQRFSLKVFLTTYKALTCSRLFSNLCSRLTNRLCCNYTNHVTGMCNTVIKSLFDFVDNIVKC